MDIVNAGGVDGWSFSLHPDGPKFTIICGKCGAPYRQRIHSSYLPMPLIPCPHCGVYNRVPLERA